MANRAHDQNMQSPDTEEQPRPLKTDYGLTNEDGFEPSKYDFYNSAYHTTSKAFVVRLEEYAPFLARDCLVK